MQHASTSPAPVPCPAGCPAAPVEHVQTTITERYQPDRQERYSSDKQISERFEPPERFQVVSDRFGSERSSSDRLPSGERYHGASERYPLGERPQTAISSDRLSKELLQASGQNFQPERYQYMERNCQRYPERFQPQNVGSLDRYHNDVMDRYSRTNTPTERYLASDKERCGSSNADRYTQEKYQGTADFNATAASTQSVCSIERYTPTSERQRFNQTENYNNGSKTLPSEVYKIRSSDRKQVMGERYQRYGEYDRFLPIPCPERFAGAQERTERPDRVQFSQVSYMEPPSPAPSNDRFIPPPPLSPANTPSPDCYPANAFQSPTTAAPAPDRFIPPPPLSPSPTENYSPKKLERYEKRYQYASSSNPNDRYTHYDRTKSDRQYYNGSSSNNDRYLTAHQNQTYHDRFGSSNSTERYIPPNAHVPVERYVPQQQDNYYGSYQPYDRYQKFNSNDPYMRRDLGFYRLTVPYPQNQFQRIRYSHMCTPNRAKCCQFQEGYHVKSSPGSSSSSSVTSQGNKDLQNFHSQKELGVNNSSIPDSIQCQNYHGNEYQCAYQQEKGVQCSGYANKDFQCIGFQITTAGKDGKDAVCTGFNSPNMRKGQCRHGICGSSSVEYVGQSGGRHVCATPPPRGSVGSGDIVICSEQCCTGSKRPQNTLALTVWRTSPSQQSQQAQQATQQQTTQQQSSTQPPQQSVPQQTQQTTPPQQTVAKPTPSSNSNESAEQQQHNANNEGHDAISSAQPSAPTAKFIPPVQRTISLPAPQTTERQREPRINYSQSERIRERPRFARSTSRKEVIKNFIKRETANFFGVDEENESEQQQRWLDRRKRLASRKYGPLKEDYQIQTEESSRRTISDVGGALPQIGGQLQRGRPDVLPGLGDVPDASGERLPGTTTIRRKDSVARMTWDGLAYVVTTLTRHQPRPRSQTEQWSRSYPSDVPSEASDLEDRAFFERPTPPISPTGLQSVDTMDRRLGEVEAAQQVESPTTRYPRSAVPGWRRSPHTDQTQPTIGGNRIFASLLDRVLDNSDRRQYGMGWVGRMFGRSTRKSIIQDAKIQEQLDDMEDYRPMFTYWVTTVQILVLFISLICYGLGPFGLDLQARSGQVLVTSLSLQQVDYMEPANFWLGPRAADLIHLGAKFAPCMRVDNKILQQIEKTRAKERETACCIRNDDSGCVQSSQADCSKTISTWKKWPTGDSGPIGRISGSVCGLDPKFCDAPASVHPYEWPDDITKWPICRKKANNPMLPSKKPGGAKDKIAEHMVCEVIGHPCCIGIHGQCRITTKEYCDFVRGTFHEEASLCSQVSCLNDVCGMIPFYFPDTPDQFYRLWTSLFLHVGILQLTMTVFIQYFLMRDLEKLTGSLRIGIIYMGSGVAGNLASAIFVPYRADVGPAGSQFGLLACLIVEVLNAWPMLKHPNQALCKLLAITFILFLVGLLPWVDNYAHLFGFVFGFLLSYALLPFVSFGPYDRQKKIILIWVCLLSAAFLFICLVLLFYIIPVYDCKVCSYFNCLPLTQEFCASQNINFKREEPVV